MFSVYITAKLQESVLWARIYSARRDFAGSGSAASEAYLSGTGSDPTKLYCPLISNTSSHHPFPQPVFQSRILFMLIQMLQKI